ncbi:hypothetical protein ACWEO1_30225 [Kitasatospora cineracea]
MTSTRRAAIAIGYAAFVQLHHHAYEMYARARLGDRALAALVVQQVLRRAELSWSTMLREQDPVAFTWQVLRDTVTQARPELPGAGADGLHLALPDPPADAALLHEQLGMAPKAAAALMGLGEPELHVQLKAARRLLAEHTVPDRNGAA